MAKRPCVLLTDFGLQDPYVGIMKGVIAGLSSDTPVIDLCHDVEPQNIRQAAFFLRAGVPYFPAGTLFVAVVDPGVGSKRKVVWARTRRHEFLAPDNGVLGWLEDAILERREVSNRALWLKPLSATFHGRDVFAPVAGRLLKGLKPQALGPKLPALTPLVWDQPKRRRGHLSGKILFFDRFGNALTNLAADAAPRGASVLFRRQNLGQWKSHYAQGRKGEAIALISSSGFLELAVANGSFAETFKAKEGDPVDITA